MTIVTVLVALACAWAWHRVRTRRRDPGGAVLRRRYPAMVAVIAVLTFQSVLGAPAMAQDSGCEAPNPERPGSGMVGALDPPTGQGEGGSTYIDYGYAGMVWHVHDCENGALGMTDPSTTVDTWAGNQLFNIAKNIVGATNSLHYTVLEGGVLNPIYEAVSRGAEAVYNNIYAQLFGLAALLLAIFLFRNIWRGDLSTVSKRALFAIGGVWLAASSLALLRYYDDIDRAIVQTTTNIQAGFVDETEDRVVRHVLPTDLHTNVVYENWLRGEFGSPDSPEAEEHGRDLLDAQAFTWQQMRDGDDGDEAVINEKKGEFNRIAGELGTSSGYFTGEDGSRTGAGFLSLAQSLAYSLFQLFAKAAVLLAQILVRLFTLTAPLIGLIAVLHHDVLRRVGKVVGGVAFNLLVLSVLAGIHALVLQAIFNAGSALSMLTQMVLAGLVTILLFLVGRPARRLWQMVEMSVSMVGSAVPAQGGGLFSRFRKKSTEPTPQDEFWQNVKNDDESQGGAATRGAGTGGRFRPEAAVVANAERLDGPPTGAHPASHWPGTPQRIGGAPQGLPAGGGAAATAFGVQPPNRAPGDQQPVVVPSRRVDTAPVSDRGLDRADDPDPFVVPSRMQPQADTFRTTAAGGPAPAAVPAPAPAAAPEPPRAAQEMVAGKPVYVLYRPSRGLEVRPDDVRDTDRAVR
ncbi:hypothetical protein [Prauserella rugosa]|uniref:Magnesium transporter n=1 Tax=Prauserella rugosa TaxID=43354 RepID=A0A660CLM2_9PSEU|nr:hypothetical protein [Prauserella rugosa]TWH22559.1 hypothetical protein JD82_04441 [Prauserella rugosa]